MTKTAYHVGIFFGCALALFAGGCGGGKSCEDLCTAREACPGIIAGDKSCKDQCTDQQTLLKSSDCQAPQDKYNACVSALKDECTATNDCSSYALSLYACLHKYCMGHADVNGCGPYAGNP